MVDKRERAPFQNSDSISLAYVPTSRIAGSYVRIMIIILLVIFFGGDLCFLFNDFIYILAGCTRVPFSVYFYHHCYLLFFW